MASSAISSRRFLRMASFTRWSCRRLSLSPRRRSSHGNALLLPRYILLCAILFLPCQQAADVFEEFIGALRAIALPRHQRLDDFVELAELFGIRAARRNGQLDRVTSFLKELLLNGLFELLVRGVVKLLTVPVRHRYLAKDLVAKAVLAMLRHLDLFLNRAQEFLIGWYFFARDRIDQLRLIQVCLDIVQVIVKQRQRFLFKGDKERFLHIGTGNLVILPACIGNEISIALAIGFFELALLLNTVFERPQHIDRVDATCIRLDQRGGNPVNNKARRNPIHTLTLGLLLNLLDVLLTEAIDVFIIIEFEFLEESQAMHFGLFET